MEFKKKIWLNVPDETKPPAVPEGQDALARFDADNMNRIETGINDAHTGIKNLSDNKLDSSEMQKYEPIANIGNPGFMRELVYNQPVFVGNEVTFAFLGRYGKQAYWYKDGYIYEFDFSNGNYSKFSECCFKQYTKDTLNNSGDYHNPFDVISSKAISKLDDDTLVYVIMIFGHSGSGASRTYHHTAQFYTLKRNSSVPSMIGRIDMLRSLSSSYADCSLRDLVYRDGYFYFGFKKENNGNYLVSRVSYDDVINNTYINGNYPPSCDTDMSYPSNIYSNYHSYGIIKEDVIIYNQRVINEKDDVFSLEVAPSIFDYDETTNTYLMNNSYDNNDSLALINDYDKLKPVLVYYGNNTNWRPGMIFIIDGYLYRIFAGWMFRTRLF